MWTTSVELVIMSLSFFVMRPLSLMIVFLVLVFQNFALLCRSSNSLKAESEASGTE